jgi:hypothetical protein
MHLIYMKTIQCIGKKSSKYGKKYYLKNELKIHEAKKNKILLISQSEYLYSFTSES